MDIPVSLDSAVGGPGAADPARPVVGRAQGTVRECGAGGERILRTVDAHQNTTGIGLIFLELQEVSDGSLDKSRRCTTTTPLWGSFRSWRWCGVWWACWWACSLQPNWPGLELNFGIPWIGYGRLRPLHQCGDFCLRGCSALIGTTATCSVRRQARLFRTTGGLYLLGWQLVIVAAAISLPAGLYRRQGIRRTGWPIDILITLVWVVYAIVFFGTIGHPQGASHLCGQLVLWRFHLAVACCWSSSAGACGLEELFRPMPVCRDADGAVVVWPQCGGLLDGGLPWA